MSLRAIKDQLIERDHIQQAVFLLIASGLSEQRIYSIITTNFFVDLDILTEILHQYPS